MNRRALIVLASLCCFFRVAAQDSILSRVILIGDAGEIDPKQEAVIPRAAGMVLKNKTTVLFLGDNVYPHGMGLAGSPEEKHTQDILKAQYEPMRAAGAPVYFIPGNHDWDRMGPLGLQKITAQGDFLASQGDSLLQLVPRNGCPDPYEINISDSLTIIAFDSEWWLFPYNKVNPAIACACKTKEDVVAHIQDILFRNRYKVILLADHHPFQSYGTHGGYFSLKDNIFPLTAAKSTLYIPLPVLGSLYPILRKLFTNPEDLHHPLYQEMIRDIDGVFKGFPNMTHVSGHEHGLQFILDHQVQVVSGAGAKSNFAKKGKYSLYGATTGGFVTADLLRDKRMRFTYYTFDKGSWSNAFSYARPYVSVKAREDSSYKTITADSVTVAAHAAFDRKSNFYRFFFGDNYRREWGAPTLLPVIRISDVQGGLTPISRGGGKQTHSLRLKDSTGKEWVLRSVEKFPDVILPEKVRHTFVADAVSDAMSAQHPYSALVVPPLANALQIPHAHPVIGLVSPDKKLGPYSILFENTVCLLEEREPIGKSDNTEKMFTALRNDNDNRIDQVAFFKARLLDVVIADWDRHVDQWRWVNTQDKKNKYFIPVPRDRDQVFRKTSGLFPSIASASWIAPFLQGFGSHIRNPATLFFSSTELSEGLLNQLSFERWMSITKNVQSALTDSVLATGISRLPASSKKMDSTELVNILKSRRDDLPRAMEIYYRFLNKKPEITLSDKNELVSIRDSGDHQLRVDIYKLSKEGVIRDLLFSKTYDPSVTRELRVFLANGNDSVHIDDPHAPVRIRIVGGEGEKKYDLVASTKKVIIYDKKSDGIYSGNTNRFRKHLSNDSLNLSIEPGNLFNITTPLLEAGYNIDDGILLGAGIRYTHQGFRKKPFASRQEFSIAHSFASSAFRVKYLGEWLHAIDKADIVLSANVFAPDNTQNFYGIGNETPFVKAPGYQHFYRARFDIFNFQAAFRWRNQKHSSISIGPSFQYYDYDSADNTGRFIALHQYIHTYDSSKYRCAQNAWRRLGGIHQWTSGTTKSCLPGAITCT